VKGLEVYFYDERVEWQNESIIFPFLPKKQIKSFTKSGVFMSKQVPLLLAAEVRNQDDQGTKISTSEVIKILFKYGDDLR
jgi:phosphatidylinositol-4-phosphate 3-kinase